MTKTIIMVFLALSTFLFGIGNGAAQSNLGQPKKTVPPAIQPAVRNTAPLTRTGVAAYQPRVIPTGKLTAYGKPPFVMTTAKLTAHGKPPFVMITEKLTVYGQP